jgi:hypothetical protein
MYSVYSIISLRYIDKFEWPVNTCQIIRLVQSTVKANFSGDHIAIANRKRGEFLNPHACTLHKPSSQDYWIRVIFPTSGFWPRVRARALRAPVFLGSLTCQTVRCAPPPPIAASLLLIYPPKLSLRPELRCTLLSYAVPLRYAAFSWVTLHPSELRCTLLSYAAPFLS